ncbi:MAG: hypothetical protein IJV85_02085 [Clostridia bacterium]|nr:hypothetical protein [Clostridia bacterium]
MKRLKRLIPAMLMLVLMVCCMTFSACALVPLAGHYQLYYIEYTDASGSYMILAGEGEGYLPTDLVEATFYGDGTMEMSTLLYSTDNVKQVVKGTWDSARCSGVNVTVDGETVVWIRSLKGLAFELLAEDGTLMMIYLRKTSII